MMLIPLKLSRVVASQLATQISASRSQTAIMCTSDTAAPPVENVALHDTHIHKDGIQFISLMDRV